MHTQEQSVSIVRLRFTILCNGDTKAQRNKKDHGYNKHYDHVYLRYRN